MTGLTRIENEHLSVEVSSLGSEMQSLTTKDGRSWLWHGDAAFWNGRSPVLFPIVGKAPGDAVAIGGKTYPMAQHGFARRREFTLAAADSTRCRYELAASDETRAVYPFDFLLAVEHALEGPALTVTAEVTNRGTETMPFGLGFHPAFARPLPGAAGKPHGISLDNGGEPALLRLSSGLLSPDQHPSPFKAGRLVLDDAMFEADAMIFPQDAGTGLVYAAEGGPSLSFRFENLPNLALWTKPGAPFICIEPWHGAAAWAGASADIAERPYGNRLAAGDSKRFSFTVEFPA